MKVVFLCGRIRLIKVYKKHKTGSLNTNTRRRWRRRRTWMVNVSVLGYGKGRYWSFSISYEKRMQKKIVRLCPVKRKRNAVIESGKWINKWINEFTPLFIVNVIIVSLAFCKPAICLVYLKISCGFSIFFFLAIILHVSEERSQQWLWI